MIRYIKLRNYRSFTDISMNFVGKKNAPKPLIILYGENGAGKSNLVSVFDTLFCVFQTLNVSYFLESLLESATSDQPKEFSPQDLKLIKSYSDISKIIQRNKTIGSSEKMVIEIGFQISGKIGVYCIEFSETGIVNERLDYTITKNKGIYFDIAEQKAQLNPGIFAESIRHDFEEILLKYKGKHSFISVLNYAKEKYSSEYFSKSVSPSLIEVMEYLNNLACHIKESYNQYGLLTPALPILHSLTHGEIDKHDQEVMNSTERMINYFFTNTYKDIEKVYYKTTEGSDNKLKYELYFSKLISDKTRDIHYSKESCGTRYLTDILPYLLQSVNKGFVAIDEIDNGIHDILLNNIIKCLYPSINGQLFFTTHNTFFLNEYLFKDSIYFIVIDKSGNKKINTLSDYDFRVQPGSNVLAKYLDDYYGGLPWQGMNVDFNKIIELEYK